MSIVDREKLKKQNRGTVLKLVATGRCTSRIALSKEMELTKPAISKMVTELMETGYLTETQSEENMELGRNPVGLDISERAPLVVGVLIMRDYCEAVLCNMKLEALRHEKLYQNWGSEEELMETVYGLVDQIIYGIKNVRAIGVAAIGPLDYISGIIEAPPYFHGIHDVHIAELLRERYQLPVYCDNDNQSAALAEVLYGKGKTYKDILLVGIANGIGCGIIVDNKKYQSGSGYTPEIGHMSINYKGKTCVCGNKGCLELYLNTPSVLKRMREVTGKFYDYKTFCELAETEEIAPIFEDLTQKLSVALISAVNILNPQLIILGHNGVWWPEKYLKILEREINERKFSNRQRNIPVMHASFLDKTAVLGGACNALLGFFQGELL